MSDDIVDRLAVYAPTPSSVTESWGPAERETRLAAILLTPADTGRQLRFVPRTHALRTRTIAPIAASVAVLVLAGGVAVLVGRGSGGRDIGPGGNDSTAVTQVSFRASVATPAVGAHQWAYRAVSSYDSSRNSDSAAKKSTVWVARDGSGPRYDFDGSTATCKQAPAVRDASFDDPTQAFVARLPTDPDKLSSYLSKHVERSTSSDEAVFTAIGNLLSTGDLLATSAQRAAMVTVLSHLHHTTTWHDSDDRGRPAFRVDFVDPKPSGDQIRSLYFDTRTFQLLEERSSDGPAPAMSGPAALETSVPTQASRLPDKSTITVVTDEKVVTTADKFCGLPVAPSLSH